MENLRLLRDVKYYETLFEVLARQYEIAKLDEARDALLIQVLDKAIEPERKSKPKKLLVAMLTGILSGILLVFVVLVREFPRQGQKDAEILRKLAGITSGFRRLLRR